MSRAPPLSMISTQFDQQSPMNHQSFQPAPQPSLSILQRAIQQSEQQFNSNQTFSPISNGFNNVAPFQPFDLISPTAYPGFPIGPVLTQPPVPEQQQQSPAQPNNLSMSSPPTMSSPSSISHQSPSSQNQTAQQTNSPRMSGGSTLQFVPSQVLRKMSKNHK